MFFLVISEIGCTFAPFFGKDAKESGYTDGAGAGNPWDGPVLWLCAHAARDACSDPCRVQFHAVRKEPASQLRRPDGADARHDLRASADAERCRCQHLTHQLASPSAEAVQATVCAVHTHQPR